MSKNFIGQQARQEYQKTKGVSWNKNPNRVRSKGTHKLRKSLLRKSGGQNNGT